MKNERENERERASVSRQREVERERDKEERRQREVLRLFICKCNASFLLDYFLWNILLLCQDSK